MKYICLQQNDSDCGFACMKMMIAHYQKNKDYLNLISDKREDYSFKDLKEVGENNGLEVKGFLMENKSLLLKKKNVICQINRAKTAHFIVFEGYKGNKIKMIDPCFGRCVVSQKKFFEMFSGYILECSLKEKKEFIKKRKMVSFPCLIIYACTFVIDFTLMYLITFFSKDSKYFYLLLLSCLGICFSIGAKSLIIRMNYSRIDEKISSIIQKEKTREEMKDLLSLKGLTSSYIYGMINSFLLVIFILFILLKNDYLNLIIIGTDVLFSVLFYYLRENWIISERYEIAMNEKELIQENMNLELFKEIGKKCNNLIKNDAFCKCILYFITIALCALISYFDNYNSLSYILFCVGCYIVLIERISTLYECLTLKKYEYERAVRTFYQIKEKE